MTNVCRYLGAVNARCAKAGTGDGRANAGAFPVPQFSVREKNYEQDVFNLDKVVKKGGTCQP